VRVPLDDKRVSAHNCRRYMATTQLAMGSSPLAVQRQMGHTTLTTTNHYASLTIQDLKRSQERYSLLRAKDLNNKDTFGSDYWEE
jgi:site-specific recombinase XerD